MNPEQIFRWTFVAIFLSSSLISKYYRRMAKTSGGTIPRKNEGRIAMLLRALLALPLVLSFFAYMINPRWMAWSTVALPVWVRWVGAGLGIACLPLLWWLFSSIGSNISETVLTKKEHKLVTTGPFRWIRHPLYSVSMVLFLSYGMIASNWWMITITAIGLVMIVLLVIPREEAELVAKFGEEYEQYQESVRMLVPRPRSFR